MRFWKVNGAGNDFILLNDWERALPDAALGALARLVCHRRLGVGADGLMVVRPPEQGGDYKMLFYNADGSMGEMCGNGARCICLYGAESGLGAEDCQRVETTAGLVTGYRTEGGNWRVRLNDPSVVDLARTVETGEGVYTCAYVELGSPGIPHAVVSLPGLRQREPETLRDLGRALRYHPSFPRGANVNFYERLGPDRIFLRTYERGVEDFTYACGTGTGAAVLALALRGELNDSADAEMRGGVLHVDLERAGGRVRNLWLTGPAAVVAKGELTDARLGEVCSGSPAAAQ